MYNETVEITGEVRAADLDRASFVLRLDDGTRVVCRFQPELEPIIIEALREHFHRRLRVRGSGEFALPERRLKNITSIEDLSIDNGSANTDRPAARGGRPIWEVFDDVMKDLPAEELNKLPADGAENHDHYIYGSPKRNA